MKFIQIIEFSTEHIDEFNAGFEEWKARTQGHRMPHRATLSRDRDVVDRFLLAVEFASYQQALENSERRETGDFPAFLAKISDSAPMFRNLDLVWEEDL